MVQVGVVKTARELSSHSLAPVKKLSAYNPSSLAAPPTSLQLIITVRTDGEEFYSSVVNGRDGRVYVGTNTAGVKLVTEDGESRRVTSWNTNAYSVCVGGDFICTVGPKSSGLWLVDVYDNDYQLIHS